MTKNHLPYWLAASYLPEVGPRTVKRWLETFTDIHALFHASNDALLAAGVSPSQMAAIRNPNWKAVEHDLAWAQVDNQHLICFEDQAYPDLLRQIYDPPLVLYLRGNKEALLSMQLAIVGSRSATPTGLANAEQFANYLAQGGLTITSGLALGIDAAAHRGTLKARGITIGVCGTGLSHIYPRSHRSLVAEILANRGAVISEFPLGMAPHAANFPRRNRIIAGLSVGVLVVEAALKSGSLISARHAIEHGRDVFAIPGSIHNPHARGCHYLIKQGAKLVETAGDILEEFALQPVNPPASSLNVLPNIPRDHLQLLEKIEYEITPIDMIILHSGLTAGEVSSILLTLELQGLIKSVSGGYVRAASNQ